MKFQLREYFLGRKVYRDGKVSIVTVSFNPFNIFTAPPSPGQLSYAPDLAPVVSNSICADVSSHYLLITHEPHTPRHLALTTSHARMDIERTFTCALGIL